MATVTDINGKFSLTMPEMEPGKAYYLEFTYLGMEKKVVRYHNSNSINVSMIPAATSQLKEVEVVETGYGRLPRKDMVGAFTTLKGEDVLMPAYQTIDQMLQGKVAGLMVVNSSSRVGSALSLPFVVRQLFLEIPTLFGLLMESSRKTLFLSMLQQR